LPAAAGVLALWVLLGAAAVPAAFGQESPPAVRRITPDEAVDMALRNNLSLESSRVSTETKKRKADLSWNRFIPSVNLGGNLIMDNEAATVAGTAPAAVIMPGSYALLPGMPADTRVLGVSPYSVEASRWHVAGSVQASLTVSAAMFEAMRTLRLDYEGGLISYEKAKAQLERDVRKTYYSMLLLQENIALLRESYEAAERRVDMARANFRSGLIPEVNLLQAQVAMENLKPTIDQAENGLKLMMAGFANNLGLPYETPFELVPPGDEAIYIPLDVAELITRAASGRPDIQELRQSILLLESTRKAQLFSLTPSLTIGWGLTSAFIQDPWKDDWTNGDYWQQSGSLTITLGLRLHSLLPFSTDFQGIKDLEDNLRSLQIGLAQAIRGTEIEVYNTVLTLEQTRASAEAQRLTADLAERTYRLTEESYRAGLNELLEVQNTELELRKARIGVLEQHYNYIRGLIDLEYAIGVPFGTLSKNTAPESGASNSRSGE
jgi:outer membrane protein TolC